MNPNSQSLPKFKKITARLSLTSSDLKAFCQKWQITELALFGSVLREDFTDESDVDILVTFEPQAKPSLLDLVKMRDELGQHLQRPVDILTKKSVERNHNHLRRQRILETAEVIYEAA